MSSRAVKYGHTTIEWIKLHASEAIRIQTATPGSYNFTYGYLAAVASGAPGRCASKPISRLGRQITVYAIG